MPKSCIIIDKMHPGIITQLESLGYKADYEPEIDRDQLMAVIHNYQGLILRSKTTIDQALIERADSLQFVARAGAGLDNLHMDLLLEKGIQVINAPEGNRDSLGEHTVGMLLNLLHKLLPADRSVRSGNWFREAYRGSELGGKVVGIIGCGNMGMALAQRLKGFGCQILGYDKYKTAFSNENIREISLTEMHQHCDIVSLHVPLSAETRDFYNYSFFSPFMKPLILINTARGEILPLADVVKLMKQDKIVAAGLDVLELEPIAQLAGKQRDVYEFLTESDQVIFSPHVAGWSVESYLKINEILLKKIAGLQSAGLID